MYSKIFEIFGITLEDTNLIIRALTHPSYTQSKNIQSSECYERLEFLGDAVLKLAASDLLYRKYPDYSEGLLSKIRSYLVSDELLSKIAIELGLNNYLILSDGEEKSGGRNRESNNACAFEALLGAFYLGGREAEINAFIKKILDFRTDNILNHLEKYNAKEVLQEYTQLKNKDIPEYILKNKSGPPHKPIFEVNVMYRGEILGTGCGKSKKEAQQNAAYEACKQLKIVKQFNGAGQQ